MLVGSSVLLGLKAAPAGLEEAAMVLQEDAPHWKVRYTVYHRQKPPSEELSVQFTN